MNYRVYKNKFGSRTKLFKARRKTAESCYCCYIMFLAFFHRCCGFHYYLDDQVDIWGRVGDGEDRRSGQGGLINMWHVRFQEIFKLFWVQITVEVLWYLEGDRDEKHMRGYFCWYDVLLTPNSGQNKMQNVTLRYSVFQKTNWRNHLRKNQLQDAGFM